MAATPAASPQLAAPTPALAELAAHATDRMAAARQWRAAGRPVVGYVGGDVPVELLTAAGALPVRLAGAPDADSTAGERYLGSGVDAAARSVLARLLAGDYGALDGLVVARDCEASARLYYALRELRRIEPALSLPPLHLVDVLHLPHRTTTRYVRAKTEQLRATVEAWVGHRIGEAELAAAIAAHDRLRALQQQVAGLRREHPARLTGTQALTAVAATTTLEVNRATALLGRLLEEAAQLPAARGTRVFLTGSGHDTPDVYAALEEQGMVIVGEDHDWGDLLYHRQVGRGDLPALAERYQHNGPSAPRASIRRRAEHTAAAAGTCRAQALLCYTRRNDDAALWDFPAQRAATGLPAEVAERQPYGAVTEGARARLPHLARRGAEVRS